MRIFQNLCDWLWYVFIIRCDEFHPSLELNMRKSGCASKWEKECNRVTRDRERAHKLEQKYARTSKAYKRIQNFRSTNRNS